MKRRHCGAECREDAKKKKNEWLRKNGPRCVIEGCEKYAPSTKGGMCNTHYRNLTSDGPRCIVEGCDSYANRSKGTLCETHFYRVRRNGTLEVKPLPEHYITKAGYVILYGSDHAMANSAGNAYQHRIVAYEAHNGVCPNCYWCDTDLDWESAVIDHLNEDKQDNTPGNLAVSCNKCNRARGAILPFLKRMNEESFWKFIERAVEYRDNQSVSSGQVGTEAVQVEEVEKAKGATVS